MTLGAASGITIRTWRDARPIDDITSSYVLEEGALVQATWSIAHKVELHVSTEREWRQFLGHPDALATLRSDTLFTDSIELRYRPTRKSSLIASATRGRRNSTFNDRDYVSNALWLTGSIDI
jgi:hypothetical protein